MKIQKLCALAIALLLVLPAAISAKEEQLELMRKGGDYPTKPRAVKYVERELEIGNLGPLPQIFIPATPRYLVTYMKSRTEDRIRSATVTTVTNQSEATCRVAVSYFKGFSNNSSPVCSTNFSISPDFTVDFCSRNLPGPITTCNSTCNPELTFDEGRAIVSSNCRQIGVSSRVYYTSGANDDGILGISDSKIVKIGSGNHGD